MCFYRIMEEHNEKKESDIKACYKAQWIAKRHFRSKIRARLDYILQIIDDVGCAKCIEKKRVAENRWR